MSDGEGHSEQGEAEGKGNAEKADAQTGIACGQNGGATSTEDQPCGPEEFRHHTFAEIHSSLQSVLRG